MTYTLDNIPDNVKARLPERYQELWAEAYNSAFEQTSDDRKATSAAWGAVTKVDIMTSIKSTKDNRVIVDGWGMLFTDDFAPDLDQEYFDALTQKLLAYYENAPLWYEHGRDDTYGFHPIGKRVRTDVYPRGIWVEHELHQDHPEFKRTKQEVDDGLLSLSGDSMTQYWGRDSKGYNYSFPLAGWSLTKTPAEPALGYVAIKAFEQDLDKAIADNATEAREAQSSTKSDNAPQNTIMTIKGHIMNEEMLAQLAAFLGLDSTDPDMLSTRLRELASEIEGAVEMDMGSEDDEPQKDGEPTAPTPAQAQTLQLAASIKSALGLAKDASYDDIADELRAVAKAVKATTEEPAPVLDGDALNQFGNAWKAAKDQPAQGKIPVKSKFADEDEPSMNPVMAKKSRRYGGIQYHQNTQKPTVGRVLQELYQNKVHGTPIKSASVQIGSNAGFLLNHEVSNEFIEVLRDKLPLADLGADMIPMDGQETLTLPKDKNEHTAYWVGEGTEIPDSDESLGAVTLLPKPLAARIIVPNKFLANSRVNYESRVEEKATYKINRALEYAVFFGAGGVTGSNTGVEPAGLTTIGAMTGRDVTVTELATNGRAPKLSDIEGAIGRVEDANVENDGSWGFAMSPRAKRFFGNMKDADGRYVLRQTAADGIDPNFLGYGYVDSNLIPNNLTVGTNSDNSTIFFGAWSNLKVGLSNSIEFFIDPYSRSSRLETVIIAHMYADVAIAHDEAFEIITGARV